MKIADLQKKRKKLKAEYDKIDKKIKRLTLIGYRAINYGDDYNYGGYQDYISEDYGSHKKAKSAADRSVENNTNGGHVEEIFPDTPSPGRIS
jgi:hypothetical protein